MAILQGRITQLSGFGQCGVILPRVRIIDLGFMDDFKMEKLISVERFNRERSRVSVSWRRGVGLFLVLAGLFWRPAGAEIVHPYEPGNKLTAKVTVEVTKDPANRVYTYLYQVTNHAESQQELELFALKVVPGMEIIDVKAPEGWGFFVESDETLISWAAIDSDPATTDVEYDNLADLDVPSPYTIKPGETLSGFTLKTPSAPGAGVFYARGFTYIPAATSEAEFEQLAQDIPGHFTGDSFIGETTAPVDIDR